MLTTTVWKLCEEIKAFSKSSQSDEAISRWTLAGNSVQTLYRHLTLQTPHLISSCKLTLTSCNETSYTKATFHSLSVVTGSCHLVSSQAAGLWGGSSSPLDTIVMVTLAGWMSNSCIERKAVKVFWIWLMWDLIVQMMFRREWEWKEQRLTVTEQRIVTAMWVVKPLQAPQSP